MASDGEHFFMHLLAICIYFEKCLFRSIASFLKWIICFQGLLRVFYIVAICQMNGLQIFYSILLIDSSLLKVFFVL